ncbi:MAG TPA: hypothetical protein VF128_12695 [Gemmatimonadaceae bacterium]
MGTRVRQFGQRMVAGTVIVAALVLLVWLLIVVRRALPDDATGGGSLTAPTFPTETAVADSAAGQLMVPDSLLGRSKALRFTALTAAEADAFPALLAAFGDTIIHTPGTFTVMADSEPFYFFIMRPFAQKRAEMLGAYRLGWWPAERWMMAENYLNPDGFVEVSMGAVDVKLSSHFRLGDFLTHDQETIWPKFVVLEERLIDKLELVLGELRARGIDSRRVIVLSGFRAPYYNDRRIDEGAARASRHQFGDAADLIIDADNDGRMDDLNRDGRRDLRDLNPIGAAVANVERKYPELVGGLGTYAAMGPSGPFAHIDVRGTSARWERARGTRPDTARRR